MIDRTSSQPETAALLSQFIHGIPIAVLLTDGDGRVRTANERAEQVLGMRCAELIGSCVDDWLAEHPDWRRQLRGEHGSSGQSSALRVRSVLGAQATQGRHQVLVGISYQVVDGSDVFMTSIADAHGRIEERLNAVIEAAPLAMVMVDQAGRISLVNAEAERQFGYSRDDLRGTAVETLLPHRWRDSHPPLRERYAGDPEVRQMGRNRTLFALRADGEEFPVEVGLSPVSTDEGTFTLAAVADITQRKRHADAALRQANELLLRSNSELQRFAYVAAHDLQTPMRTIRSFVMLLESTYASHLDEEGVDWLRRIRSSVERLQALVGDLLNFSRIESAERGFSTVDLNAVLEQALELMRDTLDLENATVTSEPLPIVLGDASQLTQVFLNLIGNAVKYRAARPPAVSISVEAGEGDWGISIADNGIGIEPRHQEKIFDAFVRLHREQEHPGTGIGLAICRKVIERHGGSIRVESQPGRGATFQFSLPYAPPEHGE